MFVGVHSVDHHCGLPIKAEPTPEMSEEASRIEAIVSASVRDMLDAYRIQAAAGPVSDKALEEMQRVALLPSVASCSRSSSRNGGVKQKGQADGHALPARHRMVDPVLPRGPASA
jgi:hypothetical protein